MVRPLDTCVWGATSKSLPIFSQTDTSVHMWTGPETHSQRLRDREGRDSYPSTFQKQQKQKEQAASWPNTPDTKILIGSGQSLE